MNKHIPEKIKGHQIDCNASASFETLVQADAFYEIAKNRLLSIEQWDDISHLATATFSLHQGQTELASKNTLQEGDYVKIKVPLPSFSNDKGYDWVRIEEIAITEDHAYKRTCITLRPSEDPSKDEGEIAHFFKSFATSTICIEQQKNVISAIYAGRNEVANWDSSSLAATVRNTIIAIGARLGASFPQWKSLVQGLVRK